MTSKEKAKELVDKYDAFTVANYTGLHEAKQCALIAVDEILSRIELLRKPEYTTFIAWDQLKEKEVADTWDGYEEITFWEEVRQEIETYDRH